MTLRNSARAPFIPRRRSGWKQSMIYSLFCETIIQVCIGASISLNFSGQPLFEVIRGGPVVFQCLNSKVSQRHCVSTSYFCSSSAYSFKTLVLFFPAVTTTHFPTLKSIIQRDVSICPTSLKLPTRLRLLVTKNRPNPSVWTRSHTTKKKNPCCRVRMRSIPRGR